MSDICFHPASRSINVSKVEADKNSVFSFRNEQTGSEASVAPDEESENH